MNKDAGTTEALMRQSGHRQILADELTQRLLGKTVLGDFGFAFKYIMTIADNGALEGINNVGSHHFGQLTIDAKTDTVSVVWQDGWENSTLRAYDADGDIKLYKVEAGQWSTTFTKIMDGIQQPLAIPLQAQ